MTGVAVSANHASRAELLALPEAERFHEIVAGELVRKAMPSARHGRAQSRVASRLGGPYDRKPGGALPGGWWIVTEVEVELETHEIYRPDIAGWRRERLAELPGTAPVSVRPDWVCEVLSESNARNDLVKKMRGYQRAALPHYWIVDPERETLIVYRWSAAGFVLALTAERSDRVRAEPFEETELWVGALFGDDE